MPSRPHNYTVAEVADILRLTIYHTRDLCRTGKVPGAHKLAGQWLIDAKTFDTWRDEALHQRAAS